MQNNKPNVIINPSIHIDKNIIEHVLKKYFCNNEINIIYVETGNDYVIPIELTEAKSRAQKRLDSCISNKLKIISNQLTFYVGLDNGLVKGNELNKSLNTSMRYSETERYNICIYGV